MLLDTSKAPWELRSELLELGELLGGLSGRREDLSSGIERGESVTPHGLALSPTMAALCAADVARTVVFARGLHAAVRDVLEREARRPVRVLYAGCGPYALLAVPALAVLPAGSVEVTLLDLHNESLASARRIFESLGLDDHVAGYEKADAAAYELPGHAAPDVVVLEIMQARLEREPQVAVTRHLLRQAPAALLVPASVRVGAELVDPSREFRFLDASGQGREPDRRRVFLGTVFELSAESAAAWRNLRGDRLPAAAIRVPHPLPPGHEIMLCTRLVVFGEHRLGDYDSGLTMPRVLPAGTPVPGGGTLEFHYRLGERPGLRYRHVPA